MTIKKVPQGTRTNPRDVQTRPGADALPRRIIRTGAGERLRQR